MGNFVKKGSNKIIDRRVGEVKEFLKSYKRRNFEKPENYDDLTFRNWKEVQETGIKFKEFYHCMCGKPHIFKLDEDTKLSDGTLRNYIKKAKYCIDENGYIVKTVSETRDIALKRLYDCLSYNPYINICITKRDEIEVIKMGTKDEILDKDTYEYCIMVTFENNDGLYSIAESIDDAYYQKVTGVIVGTRMIRIYTLDESTLIKIFNLFKK